MCAARWVQVRLFFNNSLCSLRRPYTSLRLSALHSISCIIHTNVSVRVTSVCRCGVNEVVAFLGSQPTTNQRLATSASEGLVFLVVCTSLSMLEYLLISTSLYKLRDNDKCPLLVSSTLSMLQDLWSASSCQRFTFCDSRYLLSPFPCQQFTLHTAKSSELSCLSAIWSAFCKILIGVLLPGIHRVLCYIVTTNLTLTGPCIVIYSYNKIQQDALFLKFILVKNSTCFEQIYCPSSGVLILYSQQLVSVVLVMLTVC